MKKIGLMGGSFNPIHYGHLLLAESARDKLQLDKVIFIPNGSNPLKDNPANLENQHRYNMVALAIESNPFFTISDIEIDQEGYTYTIDTVNALSEKENDEVAYYFITGSDIMFEITRWKGVDELFDKVNFITTFRPGNNQAELDERIADLEKVYNARIDKMSAPEMDISSSDIRSRVKNGYSIRYLLPETVEEYITEHELYMI
jgi:nicotinate-nucleotide adenylyltransferase